MRELVEFLARELVDDPGSVSVTESADQRGTLLTVRVAPDDMGKVIGRGGRTARALRTLVRVAGTREGVGTMVEIVE